MTMNPFDPSSKWDTSQNLTKRERDAQQRRASQASSSPFAGLKLPSSSMFGGGGSSPSGANTPSVTSRKPRRSTSSDSASKNVFAGLKLPATAMFGGSTPRGNETTEAVDGGTEQAASIEAKATTGSSPFAGLSLPKTALFGGSTTTTEEETPMPKKSTNSNNPLAAWSKNTTTGTSKRDAKPAPSFGATLFATVSNLDGEPIDGVRGEVVFPMPEPDHRYGEVKEDRYGRPVVKLPGEEKAKAYSAPKSIVKKIDTTSDYNLRVWGEREVVKGLLAHPEIAQGVDVSLIGTEREETLKADLDHVANSAKSVAGSFNSTHFGKAIVAWANAVDRMGCGASDVPEELAGHVQELRARLRSITIEDETLTFSPAYVNVLAATGSHEVGGGTEAIPPLVDHIDRLMRLPDGSFVPVVISTSKSIHYAWRELALTLGFLSRTVAVMPYEDGKWEQVTVRDDKAVVVNVPADPTLDEPESAAYVLDIRGANAAIDAAAAYLQRDKELTRKHLILASYEAPLAGSAYEGLDDSEPLPYEGDSVLVDAGAPVEDFGDDQRSEIDVERMMAEIDKATSVEAIQEMWDESWPDDLVAYGMQRAQQIADNG